MSLQPAPEPERASSYSSAALTTSGDGGGTTPGSPAGPFETELSNDNRLKVGDGWKLYERLDDCIKSYEIRPQERIMIAINRMRFERQRQPTEAEKIWLRDKLRARLETIVSRKQDILSVKRNLHSTFLKLPRTSQKDPDTYGALFDEEKAAEAHFTQPTSTGAKFPGRPPLRGSKDSKKVTLLLALVERVANIPSIAAGP